MPTEVHGLGGRAAAAFDSYDSNDDFEDYREIDSWVYTWALTGRKTTSSLTLSLSHDLRIWDFHDSPERISSFLCS